MLEIVQAVETMETVENSPIHSVPFRVSHRSHSSHSLYYWFHIFENKKKIASSKLVIDIHIAVACLSINMALLRSAAPRRTMVP